MQSLLNYLKKNAFVYVSYVNVLFFFEIINLMFFIALVFGKYFSIAAGIILSLLLLLQIVSLYFRKASGRIVQLFLMDLHLAYSLPYVIFFIVNYHEVRFADIIFVCIRSVICLFEIVFIIILSDYKEDADSRLQA
jgi:hypothetical protein